MGYIAEACAERGLLLEPVVARGLYQPAVRHGDLLYVRGQVSRLGTRTLTGPVSPDNLDAGREAARVAALRVLSVLDAALAPNERVRILKLTGYVMSLPDFTEHGAVIDGASAVLLEVLGEAGSHARAALGVSSLPSSGMVELELVCAISLQVFS